MMSRRRIIHMAPDDLGAGASQKGRLTQLLPLRFARVGGVMSAAAVSVLTFAKPTMAQDLTTLVGT